MTEPNLPQPARSRYAAFTLVEALVALSITAIAGGGLLLGLNSALQTNTWALEKTIGQGLAQQLMDEIAGKFYCANAANPYETSLGASPPELAGPGRSKFNDIDDFDGYASEPATDPWGIQLGCDDGNGGTRHPNLQSPNYFSRWRQEVSVYYVSAVDTSVRLAAGVTSDYRAVEVRVLINDPRKGLREVASQRRVFANVPTP